MENVCCAICLDLVKNEASLSPCKHLFCYECIHFWSKVHFFHFFNHDRDQMFVHVADQDSQK